MKRFEIPGVAVAKGRPRFTRQGHVYTPKKTRVYETLVKQYAKINVKKPLEKPLKVGICIHKKPPKSWSKKKRKAAIEGGVRATASPDVDNYSKAILDGMNGVAFKDDSQICELHVRKKYSEEDKAVVTLEELEGERAYE